jgi:DNA-binding MarR family transcriptional regulator
MMQASERTSVRPAREIATSVATSPATAEVMGALFDFAFALKRTAGEGSATVPILMRLASAGPLRSSDLAQQVHLDQSTVSRHVASLENDGLVRREPDDSDRRAHLLAVTEEGVAAAHERVTYRVRQFENATASWSPDDLATFARLLNAFVTGLDAQERTTA